MFAFLIFCSKESFFALPGSMVMTSEGLSSVTDMSEGEVVAWATAGIAAGQASVQSATALIASADFRPILNSFFFDMVFILASFQ